jgi:deazaflavin-dependent oxidoreductase (nitroreductase family)
MPCFTTVGTLARVNDQSDQPDEEPLDNAQDWVAEHTRRYVASNGADGHLWNGVPTLVLTTRGRRSGRLRRNALIYGKDGDAFVVVASYGGAPANPAWYSNLEADPEVTVQVGAETFAARARTASAVEKERLWPAMVSIWPDYEKYRHKTDRAIPVVLLESR